MENFHLANDVEAGLRRLLTTVETDAFDNQQCTIIIGEDIFHFGGSREHESRTEAVFNMTYGIQKLMKVLYN